MLNEIPNKNYVEQWHNMSAKECLRNPIQCAKEKKEELERKIREARERAEKAAKDAWRNVKKTLKNLKGKALSGYKKLLKKIILKHISAFIKLNGYGIATRLYPAIVSENEAIRLKYKKSFIEKSKKSYADILKEWISIGGNESKLKEAILKGSKVRIKKKSKSTSGRAIIHGGRGFDGSWSNATSDTEEYYYEDLDLSTESDSVSDEQLTNDESLAIIDEGATQVDGEEKKKGVKGFIAKILSIFRRNKADENPYEEGTDAANDFFEQDKDSGTSLTDRDNDTDSSDEDDLLDDVSDKKMMGIDKKYLFIGIGLVILVVGGILIIKKK